MSKKRNRRDRSRFCILVPVAILLLILAGCSSPLETYTVELVPLPGSPDPSRLENPQQVVGTLVLGLTEQQPLIDKVGDNRYRFTVEANITPGAVARFQTPAVYLELVGWNDHVADNRPVPEEAEVIVTQDDIRSIWLENDRLGKPVLIFEFKEEGQEKFETYTAGHVGNFVMSGIDGRVVNWIPIREPVLGERGWIEGRFSQEQALRYLWGIRVAMAGYRLQIVGDEE
jgi:preprotein translocase subunit SecD